MPIKILDPQVVSRIAAGEVVERPASVVKELVENSLDAGADQISVEVRGGGVSLIRVTDNGVGIPPEEVELAFERYATSKIGKVDDLDSISSLGFRGEALPSIAAVAQVEMVTCAGDNSAGTFISLQDGAVVNGASRGRSRGTTVLVRNLFRNVPARLKFLKSTATENSHIANVVSQYALAFPEVKFDLLIDGRTVLRTPGSGRLIDSVSEVYGLEVAQGMIVIGSGDGEWESGAAIPSIKVSGMVGSPSISRSNRSYISFFVNRRWVNSRLLFHAVEEAYHGLLMQGKYPVAVIDIALSPGEIDVNIHPAKSEVRFRNEHAVFVAAQKAVRRALIEQAPVPRIEEVATRYASPAATQLWQTLIDTPSHASSTPQALQTPMLSLPMLRVLGQFMSSYIVAEGPDGLYLIDQHAAHERILFEEVLSQRSLKEVEVQGLLEPMALAVNPKQKEALLAHREKLADFGFAIEPFGDRTYLVRAVPSLLFDKNWMVVVRELLDSPGEGDWSENIAASIACHSAVRAGQALTGDEMRELIRKLERASLPHTCPHGRPTMIHLSSGQLKREFGRTG